MRYYVTRIEKLGDKENRVCNGYDTEPEAIEKFHEYMRDDIHNTNCDWGLVFIVNEYGVPDKKHWERFERPKPEPEPEETTTEE